MSVLLTIHTRMRFYTFILFLIATSSLISCNKGYLDTKPRTDILIPTTLKDFQQLLDYYNTMNETPQLGELSADNFYLTNGFWNSLTLQHEKNGYIWEKEMFGTQKNIPDWNIPYTQVLYANVILEGLEKITPANTEVAEWNQIKGCALFARAFAFFNLAQLFSPVYDSVGATIPNQGIPLRLSADINAKVSRATVQQTYDQIINDLVLASQLLSPTVPFNNRNRASQPAALALLARVYLSAGDYIHAGQFANNALQLYGELANYNNPLEVRPLAPVSFPTKNKEVIFHTRMYSTSNVFQAFTFLDCIVDSSLYMSYVADDIRKDAFYTTLLSGKPNIKSSYNATIYPFTGLATDELYLTRAESYAWTGNITDAMADLNMLLETRWKTGTYTPFTASTRAEALTIIRTERRKELAFRGQRWSDLRRLNKKEAPDTLYRVVNGTTYTLLPNSKLYVLPIPPDVLALGGIEPNYRQ
jgi:starch-binding outer membrane protein, SusD/RagB family